MNSRHLLEPRQTLEIGHDRDAAHIERVLADSFVARAWALDLVDACERMFDGRALPQARAAVGLLLHPAHRLEQRFLGMNRDGAAARGGGGARGA